MSSIQWSLPVVMLGVSLAGCPSPTPTPDAGTPGNDAYVASGNDAYVASGSDAYVASGSDAYVASGSDAYVASGDVAACQASVDAMIARCSDVPERVCLWRGYRDLCTSGNTALLNSALACFEGGSFCRTFSDANESRTCLDALGASIPAENVSVINRVTTRCGTPVTPSGANEIFPYANASVFAECTGTACTLDDIVTACAATLPSFTCRM